VDPVNLAGLRPLFDLTEGSPEVKVGLIDGPVDVNHEGLSAALIQPVNSDARHGCLDPDSPECRHGTFVAGILAGARGGTVPAICPGCTLLVSPLFAESTNGRPAVPQARPQQLASALRETARAGARVINLSMAALHLEGSGDRALTHALDECARLGTAVVAAAGNESVVGSSCITRHPWVTPVAASTALGVPSASSNLGSSISRRGLLAPGEDIVSLGPPGRSTALSGTSAAAAFVTGTIALLCSLFPQLGVRDVRDAVARASLRRRTIVPPALDAWAAFLELSARTKGRESHHEQFAERRTAGDKSPSRAPATVPRR
jgi:subtilisin family serine protease